MLKTQSIAPKAAGSWDAILIGSGISSLTCAVLLAKAGYRVLVLERYQKFGGYMHCFERYGHRFDTGGHYTGGMAEGEPLRALFSHLGVFDDDLFVPLAEDGFDILQFRDFRVQISRGYERVIAELSDAFPDDAGAVKAFFAKICASALLFSTYNFAQLHQDNDAIGGLLSTSLASFVESLTANPRLQCVFYAYCGLHGVAPRDVSVGLHALVTDSLVRGAWGFKHGGDELVKRYVLALERLGGEVRSGAEVVELRTQGKRITEVVLATGETLQAPLIVSGLHPKATFRLLKDCRSSPAFAARLAAMEESIGFMGIYAVCSQPPPVARDRNFYVFDWSTPEAFDKLRANLPVEDEEPSSAFLSRPDRTQPESPPALHPLTLHMPTRFHTYAKWQEKARGRKPRDYYLQKLESAEANLALVDRYLPGLRRSIVKFDVSTPLSNLRYNGSEQGTAYGIYHSMSNTGARAIGPRTHVENLLLTGQNSLFPGLMGAAVSGLRTAGNLIGIKKILTELAPMVRL